MGQKIADVTFPKFTGVQINMMPIIMGDAQSIPEEYREYASMVDTCDTEQIGKVGYLTIDESVVKNGFHRRGGIHVESPGLLPHEVFLEAKNWQECKDSWQTGAVGATGDWGARTSWGGGRSNPGTLRDGGIYMASNVADSCVIWDMRLGGSQIGFMGDCQDTVEWEIERLTEHLKGFSESDIRTSLGANELWWITDRTPHESQRLKQGTKRQFFRLVTNQVSVWFQKHSTPNPLGIEPDCHVSNTDKFNLIKRFEEGGWKALGGVG